MFSKEEFLLIKLMEEAAELSQAVSKMLLYGVHHQCEKCAMSNFEAAKLEYNDLQGTLAQLADLGIMFSVRSEQLKARMEKNDKYYDIHKGLKNGTNH